MVDNCPLCKFEVKINNFTGEFRYVECPNCGKYRMYQISNMDEEDGSYFNNNIHLLSGILRYYTEKNGFIEIKQDNYYTLLHSSVIPKTITDRLNYLLLYIYKKTPEFFASVTIGNYPAIGFAKSKEEFVNMLKTLSDLKLITLPGKSPDISHKEFLVKLTLDGIQKSEQLTKIYLDNNNAFVAMWYTEEMKAIFDNYLSKAIIDAGYRPNPIFIKDFNEDIYDEIIYEIRNSKFTIADFSGHRGGVYFEAGYAFGLGKTVIYCCKEDYFNKTILIEKKGRLKKNGKEVIVLVDDERYIHFDINHKNFITWKDGNELYEKLKKRIKSTII